ncbi:hypothetical protein Acsp04_60240 [Actinomadura sp. NBRC 104425]|nr:hypothetical protein Acsp04_60240 [Actinomadura sp. NBRC 104425]
MDMTFPSPHWGGALTVSRYLDPDLRSPAEEMLTAVRMSDAGGNLGRG